MNNKTVLFLAILTVFSATAGSTDTLESPKPSVDRVHARSARISWPHNDRASSYQISVYTTKTRMGTVLANYDFDLCTNSLRNDSQDKSTDFNAKYPDFTAEKIYYPASSTGIIRISTGSANGKLTHRGFPRYKGLSVEIRAKRYPGDTNMSRLYAYYTIGSIVNIIGSIQISDDFTTGTIDLSNTPDGVAINFGNMDGFKSNRRFIIDQISFVDMSAGETSTQVMVRTKDVPEGDMCKVLGLEKSTEYSVTVTAIDKSGKAAAPSDSVPFKTADGGESLLVRYL